MARPTAKQFIPMILIGVIGLALFAGLFWYAGYIGTDRREASSPSPAASSASTAASPSASPTQPAVTPTPLKNGFISGTVNFPGEVLPGMLVCAVRTDAPSLQRCIDYTSGSRPAFRINVPAGEYYVNAHLKTAYAGVPPTFNAYHTEYVTCKRTSTTCANELHGKYIGVKAEGGKTTDIGAGLDWEAIQ